MKSEDRELVSAGDTYSTNSSPDLTFQIDGECASKEGLDLDSFFKLNF